MLLPIGLAAFVVLGARFLLERRTEKRRAAFADQLDDTLSLVASGLRAGHSLPRAMDAVSHEAESPTAEEFARILNQNRLGRDLGEALQLSAERMHSDDLAWVAQAVAIHREVGGNLSEVLDHVGETIRERNQIRRQVATLSAEGRMSANVLIALPVLIAIVLAVMSPGYLLGFLTTPLGWLMIAASLVLFAIGVIWLRAVVKVVVLAAHRIRRRNNVDDAPARGGGVARPRRAAVRLRRRAGARAATLRTGVAQNPALAPASPAAAAAAPSNASTLRWIAPRRAIEKLERSLQLANLTQE